MRSPARFLITAIAVLAGIGAADAADTKPLKIFFLTQSGGFEHSVVKRPAVDKLSLAEETVTAIGKESGAFTVTCSKDATKITPELLKDLDVMMFYSTGDILGKNEEVKPKTPEQEWVKAKEPIPFTRTIRDQAPQPDCARRTAVPQPGRRHLRQWRIPDLDGQGPRARRLERFPRAPRRGQATRQAARDRTR